MALPTIILASALALQTCDDARERFINEHLNYNFEPLNALPYKADSFEEGTGALVCATRIEGERVLQRHAINNRLEESWMFFPKHYLWLNATWNPETHGVSYEPGLRFITKKIGGAEFLHTHPMANRSRDNQKDGIYPSDNDLEVLYTHGGRNGVISALAVFYYAKLPTNYPKETFIEHANRQLFTPWDRTPRVLDISR